MTAELAAAVAALDAAEAETIRHRTDLYRLPPRGEPLPVATWAEYDARPGAGVSPACDYLNRNPPRQSDCDCGAFTDHYERVETARDEVVEAARSLVKEAVTSW